MKRDDRVRDIFVKLLDTVVPLKEVVNGSVFMFTLSGRNRVFVKLDDKVYGKNGHIVPLNRDEENISVYVIQDPVSKIDLGNGKTIKISKAGNTAPEHHSDNVNTQVNIPRQSREGVQNESRIK